MKTKEECSLQNKKSFGQKGRGRDEKGAHIMGAIFAISTNDRYHGDFRQALFLGGGYVQHCAEGVCGIAISNGENINVENRDGLLRHAFEEELFKDAIEGKNKKFRGKLGIAHVSSKFPQPIALITSSNLPEFTLCFTGNIENRAQLKEKLLNSCHTFQAGEHDAHLISRLMIYFSANGNSKQKNEEQRFVACLEATLREIKGACAIVLLTKNKIYAVSDPSGRDILVLGVKSDAVAIASESCCFYNQGFEYQRHLEPGEVVVIEKAHVKKIGLIEKDAKYCDFKPCYLMSPASIVPNGKSASEVRQELGAIRARCDIANHFCPDVAMCIEDSGRHGLLGYINEFIKQANVFMEQLCQGEIKEIPSWFKVPEIHAPLIKYSYFGRSYTPAGKEMREIIALKKQIPVPDKRHKGKRVVVVDDSIVTGNQMLGDLLRKLLTLGFSEIHLRITFSKITEKCFFGKANKDKQSLFAVKDDGTIKTDEEIAKELNVASCLFNSQQQVAEAIGENIDLFCWGCTP